jgi:hypothetical protein
MLIAVLRVGLLSWTDTSAADAYLPLAVDALLAVISAVPEHILVSDTLLRNADDNVAFGRLCCWVLAQDNSTGYVHAYAHCSCS